MKHLFIIHASDDDRSVDVLAEELAVRGIPCLADHRGGLVFATYVPEEAPCLIEEVCSGCVVYVAEHDPSQEQIPPVFRSDFARKVEWPAAQRAHESNPQFTLAAVPEGMDFERLRQLSVATFGYDLANHYTARVSGRPELLAHDMQGVARQILRALVARATLDPIGVTFNTWHSEAPRDDDLLSIDWSSRLGRCRTPSSETCALLLTALADIEAALAERHRRRAIRVRGDFHLSAAVAFGHAMSRHPLEVETSAGDAYWATNVPATVVDPFVVSASACDARSCSLYVGLTATDKEVRRSVQQYQASTGMLPFYQLFLEPRGGAHSGVVKDAGVCRAMAVQARHAIAGLVSRHAGSLTEVHVFASVPKQLVYCT
jgi:hypothetical protein